MAQRAVMGVHEFRRSVSDLLEQFREDPQAAPVAVGPYRRAEAVLVPIATYEEAVAAREEHRGHPDLPAIQALLSQSPAERLDGLCRASSFFDAAERST